MEQYNDISYQQLHYFQDFFKPVLSYAKIATGWTQITGHYFERIGLETSCLSGRPL